MKYKTWIIQYNVQSSKAFIRHKLIWNLFNREYRMSEIEIESFMIIMLKKYFNLNALEAFGTKSFSDLKVNMGMRRKL